MSKHSALVTRLLDHSTLRVPAIPEWLRADLIEAADVIAELSKPITQSADVIPWDQYPWAMCAAKDIDGSVSGFSGDPAISRHGHYWVSGKKLCQCGPMPKVTIPGPWRDSLRKRPEGV